MAEFIIFLFLIIIILAIVGAVKIGLSVNEGKETTPKSTIANVLQKLKQNSVISNFCRHEGCRYFGAYDEDSKYMSELDVYHIAGVNMYHNEVGSFVGLTMAEPTNRYDKNAIMICDLNMNTIGYIHKGKTSKICDTSRNKTCLKFVWGYIYEFDDENGKEKLSGKIFIPEDVNPFENISDIDKIEPYLSEYSEILQKMS